MLRRHAPLLIAIFFFGAAFFGWRRLREDSALATPAGLLARLPTQDAVVLSVDFAALRRGGILDVLAASKTPEEPDYQVFVRNAGFDYKRDLDSALLAFAPNGVFFLVRGRFDWQKLQAYARQQGGSCYNELCRMPGSTPARRISFMPLQPELMALAVGTDDLAASRLQQPGIQQPGPQRAIEAPPEPVWLSAPSSALKKRDALPAGARALTSAMSEAERVTLTLGPQGLAFEARLEALCRSPQEAALLKEQLEKATAALRDAISRDKSKRESGDLSAVLTAGVFNQSDRKVFGRWAVGKSFLEGLASGL